MNVRLGDPDDLVETMRVLDAGLLDVAASDVADALAAGRVLVADADGRVVGALVLGRAPGRESGNDGAARDDSPHHVVAVAVHPSRRDRGVGSALVEAAADRAGRLTAAFDPGVRPFYESLGFAVERRDGRLWGVREP